MEYKLNNINYYNKHEYNNSKTNIALFINGNNHVHIASSFIRLLDVFNGMDKKYSFTIIDNDSLQIVKNDLINNYFMFDIVIVERDFLDLNFSRLLVEKCKLLNIKLIYETDDDLINIDKSHNFYDKYIIKSESITFLVKNSDLVVVSTENLKNSLISLNKNIIVIENTLTNFWFPLKEIVKDSSEKLIKIGYMGTTTHEDDLSIIKQVVIDLTQEYDYNIVFEVIGGSDKKIKWAKQIDIPLNARVYPNFVEWLKNYLKWDFALAPLEQTNINYSKSNLKYLEYTGLGIPGIYSNVEPYKNIKNGYNGILVEDNSYDSWKNAIISLIENISLRDKIVNYARKDVKEHFLNRVAELKWKRIFDKFSRNSNLLINFLFYDFSNQNTIKDFTYFLNEYSETIIERSQKFDQKWYLSTYDDVKYLNISAIEHFINFGTYENCNPSPNFDLANYIRNNKITNVLGINPFVYYLLYDLKVSQKILHKTSTEKDYPQISYIHPKDEKNNKEIINGSNLLNEDYYLENYMDVKRSNLTPLFHWINYGFKEKFRNPNRNFDHEYYNKKYLSSKSEINKFTPFWNPLTHFILFKDYIDKTNVFDFLNQKYSMKNIENILRKIQDSVHIMVIVFDRESVGNCIKNIELFTKNYKLTLINFNNFDLKNIKFNNKARIVNNYDNLELLDLINQCLEGIDEDVIIVNSFTVVTPNWNLNLKISAYSDDTIDMVTPLSNSLLDVDFEENMTSAGISLLINKSSDGTKKSMFFSDGFCIFLKRRIVSEISLDSNKLFFNPTNNNFGYLISSKYNNILDDKIFIEHDMNFFNKNISFLNYLCKDNLFEIKKTEFVKSLSDISENIKYALNHMNLNTLSNRILYVFDEKELFVLKDFLLSKNNKIFDIFCISLNSNEIKLWKDFEVIRTWDLPFNGSIINNHLKEIYFNILTSLNINLVHINDFKYHSIDLLNLSKILDIPIVFTIKDDYILNPQKYIPVLKNCKNEIKSTLKSVDKIILLEDFKDMYQSYLKNFNNVQLIENILTINNCLPEAIIEKLSKPLNVLIIGDINNSNLKFIEKLNSCSDLELYFMGTFVKSVEDIIYYGEISIEKYSSLIKEFSFSYIIILNEFEDIFSILDLNEITKIPLLFLNTPILSIIGVDLPGVNIGSYSEILDTITLNDYKDYHNIIKEFYLNNKKTKDQINRINLFWSEIYLNQINLIQNIIVEEPFIDNIKNSKKPKKTRDFAGFQGFLANSYVQPILEAPFSEEEKCSFAFMDNISKYLRSNFDKKSSGLVSIIMPVYNRLEVLPNAIKSVFNQTYKNIELIIIDDCSTDGTIDFLKNLKNDNIKIIFNETNHGPAFSRNRGLEIAKGEYIAYLDSDNEWDEYYLETSLAAFNNINDVDAIYSGQILFEKPGSVPLAVRFGSYNKSLLRNGNYVDVNCFCHKKYVFEKCGGFDESLERLEDWDFILRVSNTCVVCSVPVLHSKYYFFNGSERISKNYLQINEKQHLERSYNEYVKEKNKINNNSVNLLTKKVSIIIPSYESLKDLRICINSIIKNYNKNIEIIVVDNNSNEAVKYYLDILNKSKKIRLIKNNVNYGFTYAVNQGIALSDKNSDILLLNNDAVLTKNAIEVMQETAYDKEDYGLVVPQQVLPGGTGTMNVHVPYATGIFECDVNPSKHHKNIINMPLFHKGEVLELNFAPFFCTYIKRNVLDDSLGLDAETGRHYRSDRVFSDYVTNILNLKIMHVSNAIVYHKLQKSTNLLKKDDYYFDLMFRRNLWEPKLCEKLNFKNPIWDNDGFNNE